MIIDMKKLAEALRDAADRIDTECFIMSGVPGTEFRTQYFTHKKSFQKWLPNLFDVDTLILPEPPPEMTLDKVMPALRGGGKIRRKEWQSDYLFINDGKIVSNENGTESLMMDMENFLATDWEIIG